MSTDARPSFYMSEHTGGFTSAAFSRDGKWLATERASDKTVKIWDTEFLGANRDVLRAYRGGSPACVSARTATGSRLPASTGP